MATQYINKKIAEKTAVSMMKKTADECSQLKTELGKLVRENYLKSVPEHILKAFEKNPSYFQRNQTINISGNGFNHKQVTVFSVPSTSSYSSTIAPDKEEAAAMMKIQDRYEKKKAKLQEMVGKIEAALLQLRTYKQVQEKFPEAYEFLPDKEAEIKALAIPIEDIRKELKNSLK